MLKLKQLRTKPIFVILGLFLGLLVYGNITSPERKADERRAAATWIRKAELSIGESERIDNEQWRTPHLQAALKAYTQAIALTPDDPAIYVNRGWVYQRLGESKNAVRDYDQAIQINPNYAQAYFNRGIVLGLTGTPQNAIPDLEKAANLFKQNKDNENYRSAIELIQELRSKSSSVSHS